MELQVLGMIDSTFIETNLSDGIRNLPEDTTAMIADAFENDEFWLPSTVAGSSILDASVLSLHADVSYRYTREDLYDSKCTSRNKDYTQSQGLDDLPPDDAFSFDFPIQNMHCLTPLVESHIYSGPAHPLKVISSLSSSTASQIKKYIKRQGSKERNLSPSRSLTAYNFFFTYERQRLIASNVGECMSGVPTKYTENVEDHYKAIWWKVPAKVALFQNTMLYKYWLKDPSRKRKHRRTHFGSESFKSLTLQIARTWHKLPKHIKEVFQTIADINSTR